MQIQHEHSKNGDAEQNNVDLLHTIVALQQQVNELTADNLLLKENLARQEESTAMIAHELRGPLTPIITYAQLIARPNASTKAIQRGTNIIIGQARRLNRFVQDLLDASRLASGRFTLTCTPCDLRTLAQEVVEQLRPIAPHHTLVIEMPETPIRGNWDAGRLQQVFGNLLDNALKYSNPETTITVRLRTDERMVHASVHNQGVSIPSAEIDSLFRPYAHSQPASHQQGSGPGLYITNCIIEAHKGSLWLEPRAEEGQGITFAFTLPV